MKLYDLLNPEKEYLKDKKAIIFDMDGTLIDSMVYWHSTSIGRLDGFASYREYMKDKYDTVITPKPQSTEFLAFLKENGVPYCIATDTPRWMSEGFFKRFPSFDKVVDIYIDSDDAQSSKSESPRIYELAAERLGFKKEECIVFEDYSHSIKSARSAGFDVVAVHDFVCSQDGNMDSIIKDNCIDYIRDMGEMMK